MGSRTQEETSVLNRSRDHSVLAGGKEKNVDGYLRSSSSEAEPDLGVSVQVIYWGSFLKKNGQGSMGSRILQGKS